ncbi:MAG: hypothetical protein INR66_01955 [Gordonia polyisoprenivorans]|nr:hypothetical protein [Gordonia polyisoprenivorans]
MTRRRRAILWSAGSLLAAVALTAGTWAVVRDDSAPVSAGRQDSVAVPTPTLGPRPTADGARFAVDFATTAAVTDIPGARSVESGRNSRPIAVDQRALRHGDPTGPDAASYLEIPMRQAVTRIGVSAVLPTGGGSAAMVAFDDSVVDARTAGEPFPYAGIHFVVDAGSWDLGVLDPEIGANSILRGTWSRPDGGDGPVDFEVERSGSVLTVVLPDGRRSSVADPRVEAWTGRWSTWELYEPRPGMTPAAITRLWAT